MQRKRSPPGPDLQDMIAGPEIELAADEVELVLLCLIEIVRVLEVAARVLVIRIEEGHEQRRTALVVRIDDDASPPLGLKIENL